MKPITRIETNNRWNPSQIEFVVEEGIVTHITINDKNLAHTGSDIITTLSAAGIEITQIYYPAPKNNLQLKDWDISLKTGTFAVQHRNDGTILLPREACNYTNLR